MMRMLIRSSKSIKMHVFFGHVMGVIELLLKNSISK
jgi:hypothetical protein